MEVEQGIGQGLELLQRQRLDLGGGGFCEGAAAAAELAKGHGRFAFLAAFLQSLLQAFLAALRQPVLYRPGVADSSRGIPTITMICASVSSGNRCTSIGSTTVFRSGRLARIC